MKLIDVEAFWVKIKSSKNIIIGVNNYEEILDTFPETFPYLQKIKNIDLIDSYGWFKEHDTKPTLDFMLWVNNTKIDEQSLFFDVSPIVQIYFPLPQQSVLEKFPNHLGIVCCMQSSFDKEALEQAWQLVHDRSVEWVILDTTDNNHNNHYILIEKKDPFFISHELQAVLNTFW